MMGKNIILSVAVIASVAASSQVLKATHPSTEDGKVVFTWPEKETR